MNELVSILIPTYNRVDVIERTVRSALAQTYYPFEVIVVDNASTDGTWQVLEKLAAEDGRLHIFQNESNIGPVRNWLACVSHAKGLYAKILWSDDLMSECFLERCAPFLIDPEVAFVYTAAKIFSGDSHEEVLGVSYQAYGTNDTVISTKEFINGILEERDFPFSPGCALFRLKDIQENLLEQVPNRLGSDFSSHAIGNDLLLFLLTAFKYKNIVLVGEPLSFFRKHEGSISVKAGKGHLLFHYDIAKAYFCKFVAKEKRLQRRLNAHIWLHLKSFGPAPYGIRGIDDFYADRDSGALDVIYLLAMLIRSPKRLKKLAKSLLRAG